MPISKVTILGVPTVVVSFVEHYCKLVGDDIEEYWRRMLANDIENLARIIGESGAGDETEARVRAKWDLEYSVKSLSRSRDAGMKEVDNDFYRRHVLKAKVREKMEEEFKEKLSKKLNAL